MVRSRFAMAVHALVLLTRSSEVATSATLAASVNTDATCLRRVLATLARAGLVEAYEGREGGYCLARSAAEISLADIYHAVAADPLLRPQPAPANPRCPISVAMGAAFAEVAADAEAQVEEALARRSLADVANRLARETTVLETTATRLRPRLEHCAPDLVPNGEPDQVTEEETACISPVSISGKPRPSG
jgi:Rrf2 family protein